MVIIVFTEALVWNVWYDPTEHHTEGRGGVQGRVGGNS